MESMATETIRAGVRPISEGGTGMSEVYSLSSTSVGDNYILQNISPGWTINYCRIYVWGVVAMFYIQATNSSGAAMSGRQVVARLNSRFYPQTTAALTTPDQADLSCWIRSSSNAGEIVTNGTVAANGARQLIGTYIIK